MTTETKAKEYSDLKARVASLGAQQQFWKGKKESHDAKLKILMDEASHLGIESRDLLTVKGILQQRISQELKVLEDTVSAAELQFNNLRSKTDVNPKA